MCLGRVGSAALGRATTRIPLVTVATAAKAISDAVCDSMLAGESFTRFMSPPRHRTTMTTYVTRQANAETMPPT